jgi:hypothetical protein
MARLLFSKQSSTASLNWRQESRFHIFILSERSESKDLSVRNLHDPHHLRCAPIPSLFALFSSL